MQGYRYVCLLEQVGKEGLSLAGGKGANLGEMIRAGLPVRGLIMETGATLSHGPVVAREYNIPAVVGVGNATGTLKDGQMVRLNGEVGTIEVLS